MCRTPLLMGCYVLVAVMTSDKLTCCHGAKPMQQPGQGQGQGQTGSGDKTTLQKDGWRQLNDNYEMSSSAGVSNNKLPNEAPADFPVPAKAVAQQRRRIDARNSWINFIRRSDNDRKRKQEKKKKQKKKSRPPKADGRELLRPSEDIDSPINVDVLMNDFRKLVQKEAEYRAATIIAEKCPDCLRNNSLTSNDIILVSRVSSAFYQKLQGLVVVESYTFTEITSFYMPFGEGSFHRGLKTDFRDGRYYAPRTGIYEFSAILHIATYGKKVKTIADPAPTKRLSIHALICIESLCRQNASLEFVAVLDNSRRIVTATLFGLLHMKENQYVSIHVDNSSPRPVRLQEGSTFTGMLVGL